MSDTKEEQFFEQWYDKNEKRFHHGQFSEKQIAYSAFVNGFNYNREIISELEQQNMQLQTEYNESRKYNSKLAQDNLEFIKENATLKQQKEELGSLYHRNYPKHGQKWATQAVATICLN